MTSSEPIAFTNPEWKPSSSRPSFGVLVAVGGLTAALAFAVLLLLSPSYPWYL